MHRINSADEFIDFANNVNNGNNNYAGETVYLTKDLDFSSCSSSFVPIGKSNGTKVFRGTFDGNGHVISNLKVSSDEFRYLGVFGSSSGATIKSLIVDSSCSFESNYPSGDDCVTGGYLGNVIQAKASALLKGV